MLVKGATGGKMTTVLRSWSVRIVSSPSYMGTSWHARNNTMDKLSCRMFMRSLTCHVCVYSHRCRATWEIYTIMSLSWAHRQLWTAVTTLFFTNFIYVIVSSVNNIYIPTQSWHYIQPPPCVQSMFRSTNEEPLSAVPKACCCPKGKSISLVNNRKSTTYLI